MKVNDLKNITLPSKKQEEFLKVDFEKIFSKDYKNVEKYELDIMGLEVRVDENSYDNELFDVVKSLDNQTTILKVMNNTPEPIFLVHKLNEDDTFYTNNLKIEVAPNVKASFVEIFATNSNSSYGVIRNIEVKENSDLEYVKVQDYSAQASINFNLNITQEKNSKLNITNFEFGDGLSINTYVNHLENEDCSYNLNGLVKLKANANCTNLVKTVHNNTNCISDINFKHTLKESSKAVFKAKSMVTQNGNDSKAFQNSNTILLSNDASIFSQPHLEIKIDELEASHGTTTGTLDKEQLLYLQSRGIKKELAYEILLDAFEKTIYACVNDEDIKEFLATYERGKYV